MNALDIIGLILCAIGVVWLLVSIAFVAWGAYRLRDDSFVRYQPGYTRAEQIADLPDEVERRMREAS